MVRAEAATANPLEKSRLLHEAGKIFQEKLGDEAQAADLYARVLQLDPEHVEAAEPLSQLYFKREEWAPLVPILEMLARKADRKTNRELTLLYHRLAKAADKLGDNEKALKYYKQSYDLDSTYLPTLVDRAGLLYRLEHWDDAFRIYQTILVHHRDTQKDDEIVDIFFRLGRIKLKLGERTKAVNMFEKALEIQPGHRATLQALIDLYTDAGDFEAVIKQKRSLAGLVGDLRRREVHALRGDRPDLQGEAHQPAEGDRRLSRGAQPQADRSPAAAQPPRPLQRDQAVEEGDGDPDEAGRAGGGQGQGALPRRGRQHRQLRAALDRRGGGALQQRAGSATRTISRPSSGSTRS